MDVYILNNYPENLIAEEQTSDIMKDIKKKEFKSYVREMKILNLT